MGFIFRYNRGMSNKSYIVYGECPNCHHMIKKSYATKRGAKCAYTRAINKLKQCQNCNYQGVYNPPLYKDKVGYELGWVEEVNPEAPRWIPVGEAMPPDDRDYKDRSCAVLVHLSTGLLYISKFFKPTQLWVGVDNSSESVTHWMALPEPPKGGA